MLNSISINSGAGVTHDRSVSVSLDVSGTITHYKIGETEGLAGVSWIASPSRTLLFELSPGYALKTIFVQVKNANGESGIKSSTISLEERPDVVYTVEGKANNLKKLPQGDKLPLPRRQTPVTLSVAGAVQAGREWTRLPVPPR